MFSTNNRGGQLPRLTNEEEVKKALKQLKRNAGQKIRRIFSNKVYLDRKTDGKLKLLSFITQKSPNSMNILIQNNSKTSFNLISKI